MVMATIEKRTTKAGERRYRVRWWLGDEKREKWFRTEADAKAFKTKTESDLLDGVVIDPRAGAIPLGVYFARWLPSRLVKGRPLRQSTRDGYARLWARTIEPELGKRKLRSLRPETIREWHAELVTTKGQDQGAKAYRLLHAVLATAVADEIIRLNPCRIRGAGQEHAEERPLAGLELVLDLADEIGTARDDKGEIKLDPKSGQPLEHDDRYRALVLTAGFAALRTGELLGLRRCDVDVLHGELRVVVQAQELKGRGRAELEHTKNDAGRRVVAIPPVVAEALEEHLATYTGLDPEAPVFVGPEGTPLRRATLSKVWRAAKKATGAPANLRIYDLRHHGATLAAQMPGITTKELMARIGHSSFTAAIRYQHAAAERDRTVADFIGERIASTRRTRRAPVISISRGAGGGLGDRSADAQAAGQGS